MSPPWRKILYENQNVPDNYVDESFLEEMKKNINIHTYEFWNVVEETGTIIQQISCVCLFVVIFIYMDEGILSPLMLFSVGAFLTVVGYIIYELMDRGQRWQRKIDRSRLDDAKSAMTFVGFVFGLSPILKTLTDTISTDTIYAMTTAMFSGNLLFHNYGSSAITSEALSLNAAVFASICLASRLPTAFHTFVTVCFAMEVFALWPVLRVKLKKGFVLSQVLMTGALSLATLAMLISVNLVAAILFTLISFTISFICPFWLIKLQPYKNNIHGPWDEAVIKK